MNKEHSYPALWCLAFSLTLVIIATLHAQTQTRIACPGEQTTHSFHRENDPEYPQLLGETLDKDFKVDTQKPHPSAGGFLYGGGANYRIGNFGHPRGTVLDHALENPKAVIRSNEFKLAEEFAPSVVILGPFGDHESQTNVSMDKFIADLRTLIARIASFKSKPVIFVVLPLPREGKDEDVNYRRIRNGIVNLKRISRILPLHVGDCAFLSATNGGHLPGSSLKLTIPLRSTASAAKARNSTSAKLPKSIVCRSATILSVAIATLPNALAPCGRHTRAVRRLDQSKPN